MLFTRVARPAFGSPRPRLQRHRTLLALRLRDLAQPAIEALGDLERRRPTEPSHVVVAHAAAEDQHTLVPQRRQRTPDRDVPHGIERAIQRQLQRRQRGVRIDQQHRHERPMVEVALRIRRGRDPRSLQQLLHARRQRRIAGGRPGQLVGVGRKAGVVEQHAGLGGALDGRHRLLPVGRDQQHGTRTLGQGGDQPAQVGLEGLPGVRGTHRPFHEEQGPPPCGTKMVG